MEEIKDLSLFEKIIKEETTNFLDTFPIEEQPSIVENILTNPEFIKRINERLK